MTETKRSQRMLLLILLLLAALLLVRLVGMAMLPLMDTTEPRYAEIGRKMAELNDWVTPWFDEGVPFWGKPPLSFWLTAVSFKVLGVTEFAARLPHLLCALLTAALTWHMGRGRSHRQGFLALAMLAGSLVFFVGGAGVMTDPALVLGTMLGMQGFWLALHHPTHTGRRLQGWLLFLGLAIALLAKGPVAAVFVALPLLLWTLLCRRVEAVWRGIPWLGGTALTALLVAPWYLLAEQRTPGFLRYFLLGEHWQRFVTPGWAGDLYGHAHRVVPGSIWLYALGATLPWLLLLPAALKGRSPQHASNDAEDTTWQRYLLLWALWPLIFFTAARNIIWPYVLPSLPALALLAAGWLDRRATPARTDAWIAGGLALTLCASVTLLAVGLWSDQWDRATARPVVRVYESLRAPGEPLAFIGQRPYSAVFYTHGQVSLVADVPALLRWLDHRRGFVVVKSAAVRQSLLLAVASSGAQVLRVGQFGAYELLRVTPGSNTSP